MGNQSRCNIILYFFSCLVTEGLRMIFRNVEHLLPLAVLLHLSIIPTETKVVTSVEECNEFFLQQTPPRIPEILEGGDILDQNRYRMICQTFNDIRTFVTLYDTHNKIPVFSAAKYRGGGGKRPNSIWMIEPQVSVIVILINRNM